MIRPAIEVRAVSSVAEYHACVALQEEVWGTAFDSVPASMLQVATYVGGLCLGAFSTDGELLGIVFGLAGEMDGRPTHWSHLLGVREAARNQGVGRLLKAHQRDVLASRGIREMCWTFDPLIARNAHLNLNLLGARVVRYVPDMYGTTRSPLHHGLATDRLLVACTTAPAHPGHPTSLPDLAGAPIMTPEPRPGDRVLQPGADRPTTLRIEVPSDFVLLAAGRPDVARKWHGAVRRHFTWALDAGYAVTGLERDPLTSRTCYTLATR